MNAPTARPPRDDLVARVSVLEEKVDLQRHELTQTELRLQNEIHTTVYAAEQRLTDLMTRQFEMIIKRQDEHFRWLFGMLIVIFLSNSATILTVMNLLQDR